jgi:molybdate transport system substrate-binding protein
MSLRHSIRACAAATLLTVVAAVMASAAARAADLAVGAASSLAAAMDQIGREFEAARPGTRVLFSFAQSDALLNQITTGTPSTSSFPTTTR